MYVLNHTHNFNNLNERALVSASCGLGRFLKRLILHTFKAYLDILAFGLFVKVRWGWWSQCGRRSVHEVLCFSICTKTYFLVDICLGYKLRFITQPRCMSAQKLINLVHELDYIFPPCYVVYLISL